MQVLIIGGTGKTGRELILQALERAHIVTVLARNPGKLTIKHDRLIVVKGDVLDPGNLENAIRGQDAVLSALGHKKWFGRNTILSEGTKNILTAMQKQQVSRFICITSLGINDRKYRMGLYYTLFVIPFLLSFYFMDKARQEKLIRNSPLNWTIIRPGHFLPRRIVRIFREKRLGKYRTGERIGNYVFTPVISRADVAHFMLEQLGSDQYLHKTPGIAY